MEGERDREKEGWGEADWEVLGEEEAVAAAGAPVGVPAREKAALRVPRPSSAVGDGVTVRAAEAVVVEEGEGVRSPKREVVEGEALEEEQGDWEGEGKALGVVLGL